ncbi:MAG: DUF177 domain-containing protein [Nitrospirota bacterium]|jgi:uncharacterized protein
MKVIISEIPDEGLDLDLQETVKFEDSLSPVQAHLRVTKVGTEVVVSGKIEAEVELQCSRCLKDFRIMLTIPLEAIYHPTEHLKGEDKHELKVDELDMGFYSKDDLDLLDLTKEQVMLNLPMKPLCNELCKGICLQCGADLNVGTCSCSTKEIDPRLEALKKLLK